MDLVKKEEGTYTVLVSEKTESIYLRMHDTSGSIPHALECGWYLWVDKGWRFISADDELETEFKQQEII